MDFLKVNETVTCIVKVGDVKYCDPYLIQC